MQSGMQMMLKAMGIDPEEIKKKGEELQALAQTLGVEIHNRVSSIDFRLACIENMLLTLVGKIDAQQDSVTPAGTPSQEFYDLKPLEVTNGRSTGID